MNAHIRRSDHRRGAACGASLARGMRISGRRLTTLQTRIQSRPIRPVNQNAERQPQAKAIGVTISGVNSAPSAPPEYETAIPRERLSRGSVCTDVRRPPGKVAPSPNPSTARARPKLNRPDANTWQVEAMVHNETAAVIPVRRPSRSISSPQTGLPTMYANENAEMI